MSVKADLVNIKAETGKIPIYFKKQMQNEQLLKPDLKALDLVKWLKDNFDLGHGHSMAIWAVFKSEGWVGDGKKKIKTG